MGVFYDVFISYLRRTTEEIIHVIFIFENTHKNSIKNCIVQKAVSVCRSHDETIVGPVVTLCLASSSDAIH